VKITPFGVAVVNGDSHLSRWIEAQCKLDVDGSAHEVAAAFIKPGDVVIDAGACLGDHTVVYLNSVGPTGTVHAFEPNPIAFECLAHNCPTAVLHKEALGEKPWRGDISMGQTEEDPPHENLGAACVVPVPGGIIRVVPLDSFELPRVNFMKLDVEGMEFEALKGAINTIFRCRPIIMAEFNFPMLKQRRIAPDDIIGFMSNLGYNWRLRDANNGFDKIHTDILFLPK